MFALVLEFSRLPKYARGILKKRAISSTPNLRVEMNCDSCGVIDIFSTFMPSSRIAVLCALSRPELRCVHDLIIRLYASSLNLPGCVRTAEMFAPLPKKEPPKRSAASPRPIDSRADSMTDFPTMPSKPSPTM